MPQLTILISPEQNLKVASGDKLEAGDIIAEAEGIKSAKLNISELLHVKPDRLANHLLVKEGEAVEIGQLIAQKKGVFSSTTIKSPISGTISFSNELGSILIQPQDASSITICPCKAIVDEVSSSSVIINSDKLVIAGSSGVGNTQGELRELGPDVDFFDVDDRFRGKIVITATLKPAVLAKMKALGVQGVIVERDINSSVLPFVVVNKISDLTDYTGQQAKLYNEGNNNYILIM